MEEYCKLPPEDETRVIRSNRQATIPRDWPKTGTVEFRNVTVRHNPNGPDILKAVNCTFEAGQRIAIVCRTGSGKSTVRMFHIQQALS